MDNVAAAWSAKAKGEFAVDPVERNSMCMQMAKQTRPPLPKCTIFRTYQLCKGENGESRGWGLVLRGTTTVLRGDLRVYTCRVEEVTKNGEAQVHGIQKGDQIASIDDIQVKDLDHSKVVHFFQSQNKLKVTILSSDAHQELRIGKFNISVLPSVWSLMNNLSCLEIIAVNLSENGIMLETLINLSHLSLCHCSLPSLKPIKGLPMLGRLRSFSLAHNYLSDEAFPINCDVKYLINLKKLNLSRNLLREIPEVVHQLYRLEVLIAVDNNISIVSENILNLTGLQTLCLDGNLIKNVDHVKMLLPSLQKMTVSDNDLEYEPEIIRSGHYLIAGVENNPYTQSERRIGDSRTEPGFRRTLSVKGHLLLNK